MKWTPLSDSSELYNPDSRGMVKCLVKLNTWDITCLDYHYDSKKWYYPSDIDRSNPIDHRHIDCYVRISEIDRHCTRGVDPDWCWEFGSSLANAAIPALEHWIEHGVSYCASTTPEEWKEILIKILDTFKLCKADLDGDSPDLESYDLEERMKAYEMHKQKRREGFQLLADYYLDMWD